jgi:hypothetical protein
MRREIREQVYRSWRFSSCYTKAFADEWFFLNRGPHERAFVRGVEEKTEALPEAIQLKVVALG